VLDQVEERDREARRAFDAWAEALPSAGTGGEPIEMAWLDEWGPEPNSHSPA
jgi:hypothetical protein